MMNKILVTLFFCSIFLFNCGAQINAGRCFVAGAIGFSVDQTKTTSSGSSIKDDQAFHFGFYPKVGYFIKDNVSVGGGIGYVGGSNNRGTSSAGLFGVSPFVRKYFQIGETGNLFFFIQMSIDLGFGHTKDITTNPITGETITTTSNVTSLGTGIAPGFTLFAAKRFATDFTFGYIPFSVVDRQNYMFGFTSLTTKPKPNPTDERQTINTFGFGLRSIIATSLTFKYFIGGKK